MMNTSKLKIINQFYFKVPSKVTQLDLLHNNLKM